MKLDLTEEFADIIGLTVQAALPLVEARGIERIRASDTKNPSMFVTQDFDENRLNVTTRDGVIIGIGRRK